MRGGYGEGAQPPPSKKILFLYNGLVVRVSASYSSDLTVIGYSWIASRQPVVEPGLYTAGI